jgi:hypothetical protein
MTEVRTHYYRAVPGLGNVAVSRHAQDRMIGARISQEEFDQALLHPIEPDIEDGHDVLWRERNGVRVIILMKPTPWKGAVLVKTVYRVEAQAVAHVG